MSETTTQHFNVVSPDLSGTVVESTSPLSVPDPVDAVQEEIRRECTAHTRRVLEIAGDLLRGAPHEVSRGLHLIEGLARINAEVLVLLGGADLPMRRKTSSGGYLMSNPDTYDQMPPSELSVGGETFGNQALQQFVAAFKPLLQGQIAAMGPKQSTPEEKIQALTLSLASAKSAKLGQKVIRLLEEKLAQAIAFGSPQLATDVGGLAPLPEVKP